MMRPSGREVMEAEDRWLPLFAAVVDGPSDMVNSIKGVHGGIKFLDPDAIGLPYHSVRVAMILLELAIRHDAGELAHSQASSELPTDWRMQKAWHRIRDRLAPGHGT